MVELAMRQANNNQTHAARLLDISRDALRYKLKKFELVTAGEEEAAGLCAVRERFGLISVRKLLRSSFVLSALCHYLADIRKGPPCGSPLRPVM